MDDIRLLHIRILVLSFLEHHLEMNGGSIVNCDAPMILSHEWPSQLKASIEARSFMASKRKRGKQLRSVEKLKICFILADLQENPRHKSTTKMPLGYFDNRLR